MAQSFTWRGGDGSLALASDWADLTTGADPSHVAPGTADSVSIAGPAAGDLTVGGVLAVTGFAVSGGVALIGAVTTGTLAVAGTLALTDAASLSAVTATLSSGALAASGAGTLVAVSGTLSLAGDASAEGGAVITAGAMRLTGGTLDLDALSAIAIGSAQAQAGTIAVGPGGVLSGSGRLDGDVADDGLITASGGALAIFGDVGGDGTLAIAAGATLFAAGAVGADINVAFLGAGATLELFTIGADFAGTLTGFAAGDAIDIASADVVAAAWAAGLLTLTDASGDTLALAMPGGNAGEDFVALPDGLGGTLVLLAPAATASPNGVAVTLGAPGLVLLNGSGHANTLTVTGTVALAGTLTTPQLTQTGTVAVLAGAVFSATSASIAEGLLLGDGAGATITVAGRLALDGALTLFAGAAASVGTLALGGGTLSLDSASSLSVGGATAAAGTIAIAPGGTLSGDGLILAPLDDDGTVLAQGGLLSLAGPISGSGTLTIATGATLAALGAVGLAVDFAATATLDLFAPAAGFAGTLSGFAAGDALDLVADTVDSVTWTAGTLSLLDSGNLVAALAIAGTYAGQAWQATPDGGGGTLVMLASGGGPLTVTGTLTVSTTVTAAGASVEAGALVAMAGGTLNVGTLTLGAGATLSGHGTVAAGVTDAGAITASGGVLAVSGAVGGVGTVAIAGNATLYAPAGIGAGMTLAFTGSGGTLELFGSATTMLATVAGLGAGNALDIAGAAVVQAAYSPDGATTGTLALAGANGSLGSVALSGAYAGDSVATLPDGRGGTLVSLVPCFVAGTRIATPRGAVAVERLRVGDTVLTPSGPRRLRWVARRRCDAAAAPELRPVRLRAGALGGALPMRDLLLSPQHALLLGGVLVPAVALLNGTTVRRGEATVIDYHHIGFDTHTTVLAEGVAAETYLPLAAAAGFDAESGERPPPGASCAPRLEGGAALEALRRALFGPPPPARPSGTLLGHVERITHDAGASWLEGWAFDPLDPCPAALPVHRDGALCGMAVANIWRSDLDRAGLGDGRCGFRARVDGPPHGLSVRRTGDAAALPVARPG